MKQKTAEFLEKLAQLCSEYGAELGYNNTDDGVHVTIDDDNVCIGFPMLPNPGQDIRDEVFKKGQPCGISRPLKYVGKVERKDN